VRRRLQLELGSEFHSGSIAQMFFSGKSASIVEGSMGGFVPAASSGVSVA
jgi:hypothetical protein